MVDRRFAAITLLVMLPGSVITAVRFPSGIVIAWEIHIYVTARIAADAENEQKITGITYRHRVQPFLRLFQLHSHLTRLSASPGVSLYQRGITCSRVCWHGMS